MHYNYKTSGVCSKGIEIDIQDNIIKSVLFNGGCDGNLKGLSRLVTGMHAQDAVRHLEGINCKGRGTSCPDQLSKALVVLIKENS
ncbi:MAG: TIGR03905 family TSCPD domain-containing protein [Defluviitaleaceae bacterium]|nr:TIGR03905 family TSCPD domain-containing protein [Defluviitaleaceae bacterium]